MPIPLHYPRPGRTDDLLVLGYPDSPPTAPDLPTTDHAMAQFRPSFLQYSFAHAARDRGLHVLHTRSAWGATPLTPLLSAVAGQHIGPADVVAWGTALELQLHSPTIVALHGADNLFPDLPTNGTMALRAGMRTRGCEVRWQLSVNIFREDPPANTVSVAPTGGAASGTGLAGNWDVPWEVNGDMDAPAPLPKGSRTTIGMGTVRMVMPVSLTDIGQGQQLWAGVDTAEPDTSVTGADAAMTEFISSAGFTALFAQASATWTAAHNVRITPVMMLGGDLASTQLPRSAWGTLHAHTVMTTDARGSLLCLGVRGSTTGGGTPRSFLGNKEFAYYVSEHIFSPLLKTRWRLHVPQQTMVKDVEFEAPLEEGSNETSMARARLSMKLHPELERCTLIVTDPASPDKLQLAGNQTVQVLGYWDPQGERAEDLGDLGHPTDMPMRFAMRMFDIPAGSPPQTLQSEVGTAIRRTVMPLYLPFHGSLPLTGLSGATSAPMRAFVVRWNLKRTLPPHHSPAEQVTSTLSIMQ